MAFTFMYMEYFIIYAICIQRKNSKYRINHMKEMEIYSVELRLQKSILYTRFHLNQTDLFSPNIYKRDENRWCSSCKHRSKQHENRKIVPKSGSRNPYKCTYKISKRQQYVFALASTLLPSRRTYFFSVSFRHVLSSFVLSLSLAELPIVFVLRFFFLVRYPRLQYPLTGMPIKFEIWAQHSSLTRHSGRESDSEWTRNWNRHTNFALYVVSVWDAEIETYGCVSLDSTL